MTRTTKRGFHRSPTSSGKQTREELLDALDQAIRTTSWRRISVRTLTEQLAQKHNSVFYYHFASIEQATRELAAERYGNAPDPESHLYAVLKLIEWESNNGMEDK